MSSGWIEGLQVSSVCKEEDASSPMKRFLYCYCYALFMFSCVSVWKLWRIMEFPCLHGNCGEGFVGLFQQQKHHWMLPLFELWSVRLHLKNPALCKGACWRVQCNMCYQESDVGTVAQRQRLNRCALMQIGTKPCQIKCSTFSLSEVALTTSVIKKKTVILL